ncbi:hypothetical protein FY528_05085 [Hymenobacter lutimineralis]|uniref:Uncharacterized protein n=1 Tax=Hymenobacter lutimineralis TaxID=2606448 RepID=A0A5D6VAV4_9BACT|nr:hypothetical protein [Hymenobacter lutimineralis]TYZ12666.1 hypothetical protein FY528_05085 [Hymenobacter lutimineralis]
MKSTNLYRPAKRIPADRLAKMRAASAAKKAAAELAHQQRQATPEFAPVPSLKALPGGLHWSAQQPVPAVGKLVSASQGGKVETVKVLGYCHAAGFIGLVTQPFHPGSRRAHKMHPRAHCVFGSQLAQAA